MLDPFRPERPEDVERLKRLQAQIHENFIAQVRTRRGDAAERRGPLHRRVLGRAGGRRRRAGRRDRASGAGDARGSTARRCASRVIAPRRPLFRRLGPARGRRGAGRGRGAHALDPLRAAGAMIGARRPPADRGGAALAIIGKLRLPQARRDAGPAVQAARKCPDCGAYVVGAGRALRHAPTASADARHDATRRWSPAAAQRLGAALVRALAARGADVAIHCHASREDAEALAEEVRGGRGAGGGGAGRPARPGGDRRGWCRRRRRRWAGR